MNKLYFSDCLNVLKDLHAAHPEGFIDLVYIDPPFNSKRDYNILFESIDMKDTKAQKEAFSDTWSSVSYIDTINEIQSLDLDLYRFLSNLDMIKVPKSTVSYLATMSIRIYYIHKVIKETGSFYVHCDPTMSHYLKLVCDLIFGAKNFRNEIIWQRMYAHNDPVKYGKIHDCILYYSKTDTYIWNKLYTAYDQNYLKMYSHKDEKGRLYKVENTLAPGGRGPIYEWNGIKKAWRYTKDNMQKLHDSGRLYYTRSGFPKKIQYLDEMQGRPLQDIWNDINVISGMSKELLGYPTQKPEALLERILQASSNKGDLVADFFCGCGTSIAVAQRLKRNWIGVDISHLAIRLILDRLTNPYPARRAKIIRENFHVTGFPRDIDGAKMLARETDNGRFGFQDWIIEVMLGGVTNPKKSADGGFDGYLPFYLTQDKKGVILIEVKSGNLTVKNMREFIQVIERQKANLGVFVCFEEQVTQPMREEAKRTGYFESESYPGKYDKIQILTVEDLLDGSGIALPYRKEAFKTATKNLDYVEDEPMLEL